MIHKTATLNGEVILGKNVNIGPYCSIGEPPFQIRRYKRVKPEYGVKIGDNVTIGAYTSIVQGTTRNTVIGDKVHIAQRVNIGHDSLVGDKTLLNNGVVLSGFVEIGRLCKIYTGVLFRERIRVGDRTQIGMGSIVTKDIPSGVLAYGAPCKVKKKLNYGLKELVKEKIL